jgi:hypothetical protein
MSVRRYLAAVAISAAVATPLTAPGTAGAAPLSTVFRITAAASPHRCLDADEHTVYTLDCNGGRNQQWDNYAPGLFRNVATGSCLAAKPPTGTWMLLSCGADSTKWTTSSTTNKYIKSSMTLTCLDNNGGNAEAVGLAACRAGTAALWNVTRL